MSNPNEVNVRISVETSNNEEKACKDDCCESKPIIVNYVVMTTYGQFLVEEVARLVSAEYTTLFALDGHILASFDSADVLYILDADKVSEIYDDPCEDCDGPCCCEAEDHCEDSGETN